MHGGADAAIYRGVDRRQRFRRSKRIIRRHELFAVAAALLVIGVAMPIGLTAVARPAALGTQAFLRNVWSILFICAGVLHLVRWRVTGETRSGLRGGGTFALGVLSGPTLAIAPLLYAAPSGSPMPTISPMVRAVAVSACLILLARAVHTPPIDSAIRPLRLTVSAILAAWLFIGVMALLTQSNRGLPANPTAWSRVELALTGAWILCCIGAVRRARVERDASLGWLAIALGLMATAELLRFLSLVGRIELQFFGTGVQLVVGAVALVNATKDLGMLLHDESSIRLMLSGVVRDTERQLTADDREESRRRHDARSVLASLRAASLVLDRYDATLDAASRAELLTTFDSELRRLEAMVERRAEAPLETFRLDALLVPALARLEGVYVRTELDPVRVRGRAVELVSLVEGVVAQLGRRSRDGVVRVRVGRSTGGVQLVCEAAVPPGDASVVEAESARALRLQVARRVMREQGGDVVVHDRWDGTSSVVVWLRPADAAASNDVSAADVAALTAEPESPHTSLGTRLDPRAIG